MNSPKNSQFWSLLRIVSLFLSLTVLAAESPRRPNIILILADDLGYGDIGSYNPESKILTPHLDRLSADGISFMDAHTPSAVCTPTRYGLLTGRYSWRTWLTSLVLDGFDPPLIEAGRPTLASAFKERGYDTACVGKWHLGMTWTDLKGRTVPFSGLEGEVFKRPGADVDYSKDVVGGPLDVGFDHFFGISASLDMSPYAYIQGRRIDPAPTIATPEDRSMTMNQVPGVTTPDFVLSEVLGTLGRHAADYVTSRAGNETPFFLYFALPSPHMPVVPSKPWLGRSEAGIYGDFMMETDAEVGRILAALDRIGKRDNTIVIFTSDNGGLWHEWHPQEKDDLAHYRPTDRAKDMSSRGHRSNAHLRGTKADIYEGGHRVPMIVRWPEKVVAGQRSDALVELNDWYATLADVVGFDVAPDAAEDSFSFLQALTGDRQTSPLRSFAVHHSLHGAFALREGPWKFVPSRGSGGFSLPRTVVPAEGEATGQLYHLYNDPVESRNLWKEEPDLVRYMKSKLDRIRAGDRTRASAPGNLSSSPTE